MSTAFCAGLSNSVLQVCDPLSISGNPAPCSLWECHDGDFAPRGCGYLKLPVAGAHKEFNPMMVCRAEHVINSETEDITKRVKEITGMLHQTFLSHFVGASGSILRAVHN